MNEKKALVFNIQRFSLHDGPGIRTAIFYKGCPLRCSWCSNPESQSFFQEEMWDNTKKANTTVGNFMTVDEIMQEVRKDLDFYLESNGGVTVTGGEVLAQKDQVVQLLKQCQKEGIHTACETSAFGSNKEFIDFINHVDLLMMDIKHYDNKKHQEKTGVILDPILKNLKSAISMEKEMLVRIPVIPNFNDSLEDAENFGQLLKDYGIREVELLPFHQFGQEKYKYLNRTYEFDDIKQIPSEQLIPYQKVIEGYGIKCKLA